MTDREKLVEQLLIELHDLEFHGKNLAHLEKLADFILEREGAARDRGYNTGFQKAKRIGNRYAKVAKQLRIIAEKLDSDDAALIPKTTELQKYLDEPCPRCNGTAKLGEHKGVVGNPEDSCYYCDGTGKKPLIIVAPNTEQKEDV